MPVLFVRPNIMKGTMTTTTIISQGLLSSSRFLAKLGLPNNIEVDIEDEEAEEGEEVADEEEVDCNDD